MSQIRFGIPLGIGAFAIAVACCDGSVTLGSTAGDAGSTGRSSGGSGTPTGGFTSGSASNTGLGPTTGDGSVTGSASGTGLGSTTGDGSVTGDASSTGSGSFSTGGTYVDAGYYRGDGSYFVDGGAYPDVGTSADVSVGGGGIDASPGCQPLALCCSSLSSGNQTLCNTVVASGNATSCSAELTQLQSLGSCTGISVLASEIQVSPARLVSDGAALFWTASEGPGLQAMPVHGGPITILLTDAAAIVPSFLEVDAANVYVFLQNNNGALVRLPKSGAPPSMINGGSEGVGAATTLAGRAYWLEAAGCCDEAMKSAPLLGGPISQIAVFSPDNLGQAAIGVTSTVVFLSGQFVAYFPLTGLPPDAGAPPVLDARAPNGFEFVSGQLCNSLASDTNAVYCAGESGTNESIASNGSVTSLGASIGSSYIVFDDTYVYWADMVNVGTIMKAPKAGGGTATVLARDTSPTAIAVDSTSVYWSDAAGYIKSVPK
jgi:hypothetical protein